MQKRENLDVLKTYTEQFSNNDTIPLRELNNGTYNVMAIRECQTKFGDKHILLVEVDDKLRVCYSNTYMETTITRTLNEETKLKIRDPVRGYLTLYNKPIAALTVTGRGYTDQRHVIVYCTLTFTNFVENDCLSTLNEAATRDISRCENDMKNAEVGESSPLENIPIMDMYKHIQSLTDLPVGTCKEVLAIGRACHYGQNKLVVKLDDGNLYQAGDYLEEHEESLVSGCKIVIDRVRLNKARRKYAVCKIVRAGDWAGVLDYNKVKLLPGGVQTGHTVLDVRSVNVKGTKRKLVLMENGDIYKIKKV